MAWYKRIYDGELMGKFWEMTLLKGRYVENIFLQRFLKDGSVLDLGCGPGSHSAYLSKYQQVIGLDLSKYLITRAKEKCKNNGKYEKVDLIRADMISFPFRSNMFDNVINIISFGHFSDEENEFIFSEIVRLLKKGGIYVHQSYYHPPSTRPLKWEKSYPQAPKGFFITKERKYDPTTKRVHIKETIEDTNSGEKVNFNFKNRLFDLDELKELHGKNSLKIIDVFGSFEMKKFDEEKFGVMIIVSEKS